MNNIIKFLVIFFTTFFLLHSEENDLLINSKAKFKNNKLWVEVEIINNTMNPYYILIESWKLGGISKYETSALFYPNKRCMLNYFYYMPENYKDSIIGTQSDCTEAIPAWEITEFPCYKKLIPNEKLKITAEVFIEYHLIMNELFSGYLYKYMEENSLLLTTINYMKQNDYNFFIEENINLESYEIKENIINLKLNANKGFDFCKSSIVVDPKLKDKILDSFSNRLKTYCKIEMVE